MVGLLLNLVAWPGQRTTQEQTSTVKKPQTPSQWHASRSCGAEERFEQELTNVTRVLVLGCFCAVHPENTTTDSPTVLGSAPREQQDSPTLLGSASREQRTDTQAGSPNTGSQQMPFRGSYASPAARSSPNVKGLDTAVSAAPDRLEPSSGVPTAMHTTPKCSALCPRGVYHALASAQFIVHTTVAAQRF